MMMAMDAGAAGALIKDTPRAELVAAIRNVVAYYFVMAKKC